MADLDALEAVLAKATQGEWRQQFTDFEDGGIAVVAHIVEQGVVLETPTNGMVCWANMLPVERDQYDDDRASANAAAIVALHNAAPALIAEHRALLAENTALRSALANSPGACVYCQLPANEMNRCASGFPGCGRADDMQGCPHFGPSEIPEDIQEQHVALLARVEELEGALREVQSFVTEAIDLERIGCVVALDAIFDTDRAALEAKP